jgi:hypothetical protein
MGATEPRGGFLGALPVPPRLEEIPIGFHLMETPHAPRQAMLPWGDSEPHRARRVTPEPPPKPTSRCFPR